MRAARAGKSFSPETIAPWRRQPVVALGEALSASFLKHSEDQTVLAVRAVLDALAQVSPSDLKNASLKKPEPKAPPKRRVAKRQVRLPMVAYAQSPPRFDFDFFAHN